MVICEILSLLLFLWLWFYLICWFFYLMFHHDKYRSNFISEHVCICSGSQPISSQRNDVQSLGKLIQESGMTLNIKYNYDYQNIIINKIIIINMINKKIVHVKIAQVHPPKPNFKNFWTPQKSLNFEPVWPETSWTPRPKSRKTELRTLLNPGSSTKIKLGMNPPKPSKNPKLRTH